MPTGRARFHLLTAGRSLRTPTHTTVDSTCKPVTNTRHLFLFCVSPSAGRRRSAQLGVTTQEEEGERSTDVASPPLLLQISPSLLLQLPLLSYVSVCSHAATPPRSFITLYRSLSLSAEAANQLRAEDRDLACDEWREDTSSSSLYPSTLC